jgi:hypothetical protein
VQIFLRLFPLLPPLKQRAIDGLGRLPIPAPTC